MKKYRSFLSQNFQFLEVKFSLYLNRRVFVMDLLESPRQGTSNEYPQHIFNGEKQSYFHINMTAHLICSTGLKAS